MEDWKEAADATINATEGLGSAMDDTLGGWNEDDSAFAPAAGLASIALAAILA